MSSEAISRPFFLNQEFDGVNHFIVTFLGLEMNLSAQHLNQHGRYHQERYQ